MVKKLFRKKHSGHQQPPVHHQTANHSVPPKQPSEKARRIRSGLSTIGLFLLAPVVAILLTSFVFQSYQVDGPSMEATLNNNDRLIINKLPKTWSKITGHPFIPNRGEIIVFVKDDLSQYDGQSGTKQLIKRVIGLPGDRVVVQNEILTIYNQEHPEGFQPDETYGYKPALNNTPGNIDITIPENEVFVCGDNRANSLDSRSFGPIEAKDIVGDLSVRVLPLHDAEKF